MKKNKIRSGLLLAILFLVYNLIAFLIPFYKASTFWAAYIFGLIALTVVAVTFYRAFIKNPNAKSRFYGFPIAKIGIGYGAVQLISSLIFMSLGKWIPAWGVILVSSAYLGVTLFGLISADAVIEEIEMQDVKLQKAVSLMRSMQSKLSLIVSQCGAVGAVDEVKNLADEMRYSDPVSSEALAEIETELSAIVDELQQAVIDGDSIAVRQLCHNATMVLAERNRLCKLNKN